MTTLYHAIVHVVVEADTEAEACDAVAEGLRGNVLDWGYQCGGGYRGPKLLGELPEYEEGDFYGMVGE